MKQQKTFNEHTFFITLGRQGQLMYSIKHFLQIMGNMSLEGNHKKTS
jgi:hypothetical protein